MKALEYLSLENEQWLVVQVIFCEPNFHSITSGKRLGKAVKDKMKLSETFATRGNVEETEIAGIPAKNEGNRNTIKTLNT